MEFVTLKKNNTKKVLLVLVVFIAIVVTIVSLSSRAKYQVTSSAQIVKGTVNYKPYDFKIVEIKKENDTGTYELTDEVPTEGYEINEKDSKCMIDDETEDENAILKTVNGNHTFANLKKLDKCTLYFSKKKTAEDTLAQLGKTSEPGETDGFTGPDISEHTNNKKTIMYSDEDDLGTTYYFRGKVKDNWVKFGKADGQDIWWRIIRINGNGSIRMIYTGIGTNAPTDDGYSNNNTTGSQLQTKAYNAYYNDNTYVGYMYGGESKSNYNDTHANISDSYIKQLLDTWYSTNLKTEYGKYIDPNAGFCNDRQINTQAKQWWISDTALGYGKNYTAYAPLNRLMDSMAIAAIHTPIFKCNQQNDTFTLPGATKPDGSDYGNHKLLNNNGKGENSPIGLITIDEAVFAGGYYWRDSYQSNNTLFYLYTGQSYWTMSPVSMNGTGYASAFIVSLEGYLSSDGVDSAYGVRPVINIKADVTITGSGTVNEPYEIS